MCQTCVPHIIVRVQICCHVFALHWPCQTCLTSFCDAPVSTIVLPLCRLPAFSETWACTTEIMISHFQQLSILNNVTAPLRFLFQYCGGTSENNRAKRDCCSEDLPPCTRVCLTKSFPGGPWCMTNKWFYVLSVLKPHTYIWVCFAQWINVFKFYC
jgi:hypothetical protein